MYGCILLYWSFFAIFVYPKLIFLDLLFLLLAVFNPGCPCLGINTLDVLMSPDIGRNNLSLFFRLGVVISNLDKLSQQSNEVPNQDLSLANQDVSFNYVFYIFVMQLNY